MPSSSLYAGTTTILKHIPAHKEHVANVGSSGLCEEAYVVYPKDYIADPFKIGTIPISNRTKVADI